MDFINVFLWLLFTSILLLALRSIRGKRSGNLPPGPFQFPIVGNLLQLGDEPLKSLAKLAMTHGPIVTFKLGQVTTIVISSASLAKEVNQKHDRIFSSRVVSDNLTVHNHHRNSIIWLPPTHKWRNLRKICTSSIFAAPKLDATQHVRSKKVEELVADVRECSRRGTAVEIGRAAFSTTINLLSNTIFSYDLAGQNSDTATEFKKAVEGILKEAAKPVLADCFPALRAVGPQGARRRIGVYCRTIYGIFRRVIDERLHQKPVSNDALDDLLQAKDEEEIKLEPLLLDLFMAGTDSTSNTVEWAIAELLRSPEKLRKAQAELEQSIGRGNAVKESDIPGLPYLQAVVKETLRLHPSVPLLIPRKAEEEVEIGGFTIPKGAQVLINAWAIGRDPTTWEDPNSFVPERFLGSDIDVKGLDFELIPFGAGRRICLGMPLALRMVHVMVASLIHGFEWKLEEEMNMDEKFGLVLSMAQHIKAVPVSEKLSM